MENQEICTKNFDSKEIKQLIEAIQKNYYFEFIIDDLPVRGFIGSYDSESSTPHLFLHLNFLVLYNGDRVFIFLSFSHFNYSFFKRSYTQT